MKKKPTANQKKQAEEKRLRFRALAKRVAAMTEEERQALIERFCAVVTCEGHALAPYNTCLILTQAPNATVVGGFQQWRRVGRSVRKGEHGIAMLFPLGNGKQSEPTSADIEEDEPQRKRFGVGYVFDVTQTDEIAAQVAA